ncbi:MAG: hypothetical protein HGA96_04195 [Desulfobulbaceae bacterium]|nr:hypothetical protein [Desulfobulbaceae bacterium]
MDRLWFIKFGSAKWTVNFCVFLMTIFFDSNLAIADMALPIRPGVVGGSDFSLALDANGVLYGWGDDSYGQLGVGRLTYSNTPRMITSNSPVMKVAVGGYGHQLFITEDGNLWAIGSNYLGQLGVGSRVDYSYPVLVGAGFTDVAASSGGSIALKNDRSLWIWGDIGESYPEGRYGNDFINTIKVPYQIGMDFVSIAAGSDHVLALDTKGFLLSCGYNGQGQLGDGTTSDKSTLSVIGGGFSAIAAGGDHSLALKADGTLWAWGDIVIGRRGDGSAIVSTIPVQIGDGFAAITTGYSSSVAIKNDGSLWQWSVKGDGLEGGLSLGKEYTAISLGAIHELALKADGSLWAWGNNHVGQLGDGTTHDHLNPVLVGNNYKAVGAGNNNSMAIKTDGTLWTWGDNTFGQLGDSSKITHSYPIVIGSNYATVSANGYHVLGIKTDGSLWTWGGNGYGQLGDGTYQNYSLPVQIGTGFRSVTAGESSAFAIKKDGSLWGWGSNADGLLGNGSSLDIAFYSPVQIGAGFSDISSGGRHILALKTDGSLWTWGWNRYGQLGDGTTVDRSAPVKIGTGFTKISAGYFHSMAIKPDGSLWAWGYDALPSVGGETLLPTLVSGDYRSIFAADSYSLALNTYGELLGWGSIEVICDGCISQGAEEVSLFSSLLGEPEPWHDDNGLWHFGANFSDILGGSWTHRLAMKHDGTLRGWGFNYNGQLGNGYFGEPIGPEPVINSYVTGFLDLLPSEPNNISLEQFPGVFLALDKAGGLRSLTLGANVYLVSNDKENQANKSAPMKSFSQQSSSNLYKIYVAALVPEGLSITPGYYFLNGDRAWSYWSGGALPEYLSNIDAALAPHADVSILEGMDVSPYIGTQIYVGYGIDDQEMIAASRYRAIYTVKDE